MFLPWTDPEASAQRALRAFQAHRRTARRGLPPGRRAPRGSSRLRCRCACGWVRRTGSSILASADGIIRQGNTLYIDRSVNDEVSTVQLSDDATSATIVSERTYPGIDTPTGVTISGDRLLVTNSQMNNYFYGVPPESSVFTVESLPLE